jgi:hypothetical protein
MTRIINVAFLVLVLALITSTCVSAQQTPSITVIGIGGGGPMPGFLFLELEELRDVLMDNGYAPLNGPMFMTGGGGYGGLMADMRYGGAGLGGEISSTHGEKTATLSIGFGGFMIERGLDTSQRNNITIGAIIGGGGADLNLTDHRATTFEGAVADVPNLFVTRDFFAIEPYVGLEIPVLSWVMLKVQLGYLFTFGGEWQIEGYKLPGPPKNFNAPVVSIMVSFGGSGPADEPR